MNEAMQCYSAQKPLSFDLKNHLLQLEYYFESPTHKISSPPQLPEEHKAEPQKISKPALPAKANEFETLRVSLQNLDNVSFYMEEIQTIKIAIEEYFCRLNKMNFKIGDLLQSWKKPGLFKKSRSR